MVAVTGKCDCWCRMDYLTSVKCSFQCMWELVIVSSTVQSHLSSLGAVNNHNYAAHTHTLYTYCTHTHRHDGNPLTLRQKAEPSSFGGFHGRTGETGSVINPFRALLHLLAAFLYMCLSSGYVLYIHTPLSIQALWLDVKECCIVSLFQFGLKCAYLPFFLCPSPPSCFCFSAG